MYFLGFFSLVLGLNAVPINVVRKAAENNFEKLDNYLPKVGDYPKFHYATFGKDDRKNEILDVIDFRSSSQTAFRKDFKETTQSAKSLEVGNMDMLKEGAAVGRDNLKDISLMLEPTLKPDSTTGDQETTTIQDETTTQAEITTISLISKHQLDPVLFDNNENSTANRTIRQGESGEIDDNSTENKENDGQDSKEQQEEDEEEEEEDENMITGLISAFLGGLSRPDGSVDVEAITGLLGSLSTQNEDGTYDFNGLTELLMSFFGGEGGSDFGAFLGGILGAFIKGVANPPGAKGAGMFIGNLLGGILPGLSAPAPTEEGQKPQPPLDSGGFLGGLLSSVFGNLANLSGAGSRGNGGDSASGDGGNKFSLIKALFSGITSIFSSSSKH